jgi:hypothetical protein
MGRSHFHESTIIINTANSTFMFTCSACAINIVDFSVKIYDCANVDLKEVPKEFRKV